LEGWEGERGSVEGRKGRGRKKERKEEGYLTDLSFNIRLDFSKYQLSAQFF